MLKIRPILLAFPALAVLAFILLFSRSQNLAEEVNNPSLLAYPAEEFFLARAYPDKFIDQRLQLRRLSLAKEKANFGERADSRFDIPWTIQGPGNIGARVNTIAIHPDDDQVMLAGFAGGGLFRTTDNGHSWEPVFDDKFSLSIGDISFDPSNPDIVYAGTGDPNIGGYPSVGTGVYKCIDQGLSWNYSGLAETGIIAKVESHPTESDIVTCAAMGFPFAPNTDRGLYRSYDGGNSWDQILFLSDSTGVIDFIVHPENPEVIIAAGWDRIRNNRESIISGNGAKIYRTIDGGAHWEQLSNGLPNGEYSRIGLAVSPTDPDNILAMYVGQSPEIVCLSDDLQLAGMYRTLNGGDSWEQIPTGMDNGLNCDALGDFGWYFGKIRMHPENPEEIYLLGIDLWRTTDGGNFWERIGPPWFTYEVHADKHDLVFVGDSMILTTDGGIYKAARHNTENWRDLENIVATQFYRTAYNPHQPDTYYGGAQDNGSTGGNAEEINNWPRIFGGDGFQMLFDRDNPDVIYCSTQRGNVYASESGFGAFTNFSATLSPGSTKFWDMPFVMSHHRSRLLYAGSKSLWRAGRGPKSIWEEVSPDLTKGEELPLGSYPAITAIAESPLDSNVLIAGTQDGKVWVSQNYGFDWSDATPGLPDRFVTSVAASYVQPDRLYVAHSAYRDGDNTAYLHMSVDGGHGWLDISGDLPPLSINDIFILPTHNDSVIFVGTDGGIYGTIDGGEIWERVGRDFPYIPVYDIVLNEVRNELVAATFARGIQSFPLDSVSLEPEPSTGSEEVSEDLDMQVRPTLASRSVHVSVDLKGDKGELRILDAGGRVWKTMLISGKTEEEIWLSQFPNGILYVSVITGRGQKTIPISHLE